MATNSDTGCSFLVTAVTCAIMENCPSILRSLTVILSIVAANIAGPFQREAVPTLLSVLLPLVTQAQLYGFLCISDEQRGYSFSSRGSLGGKFYHDRLVRLHHSVTIETIYKFDLCFANPCIASLFMSCIF